MTSTVTYPCLLAADHASRWALTADEIVVGRGTESGIRIDHPTVSRRHCAVRPFGGQYVLEHLSATQETRRNGQRVVGTVVLRHGDRVTLGDAVLTFLEHEGDVDATPGTVPAAAEADTDRGECTLKGRGDDHGPVVSPTPVLAMRESMMVGRDADRVELWLDHPLVSRVHAQIRREQVGWTITDLGSANGTFVNNARLLAPQIIQRGDRLKIGPYVFTFDGEALIPAPILGSAELRCRALTRTVSSAAGTRVTLLDEIDLVIRPGEFACIIGPSGSGKSTLLDALSGRIPATAGLVEVNGIDLYTHFDALKRDLAVVPQRDIVHDSLGVGAALRYTARLRLPPDMGMAEIEDRVNHTLRQVSMLERRDLPISRLSGGQLKRAVLANELISNPSVIFLDEVTSGLDAQTDREMMRLFRQIADGGKTIVCVTHSLTSIEATATLVVVLAPGGRLAFVGQPREAVEYFGVRTLGEVYDALAESEPDELKCRFEQHPLHTKYIAGRLGAADAEPRRRFVPIRSRPIVALNEGIRQWCILASRYTKLLANDLQALTTMVLQPLVVGLVLALVVGPIGELPLGAESVPTTAAGFGGARAIEVLVDVMAIEEQARSETIGRATATLFFLLVACFWFGCNNAAKEIVKERPIYEREQSVNLRPAAYYFSKLGVMGALSLAQVLIALMVVKIGTGLPGSFIIQAAMLGSLALAGTALGLLLSALAATEERAVAAVPLVLIPQVILAGAVVPLEGLGQLLGGLAITCHWSYRSLSASMPAEWADALGAGDWSAAVAGLMVALHMVLLIATAVAVLEVRARRLQLRSMLRRLGVA